MQITQQHFLEKGHYLFNKKLNIIIDFAEVVKVEKDWAILDNGDRVANPLINGSPAFNNPLSKYYYESKQLNEQYEKNQDLLFKLKFGVFCALSIVLTGLWASALSTADRGIDPISYYRRPYVEIPQPCTSYLAQFETTPVVSEGRDHLAQGIACMNTLQYPITAVEYQQLQKNLKLLKQLPDTEIIPITLSRIIQKNIKDVNLYEAAYSSVSYLNRIEQDWTISLFLINLMPMTLFIFFITEQISKTKIDIVLKNCNLFKTKNVTD